MFNMQELTASTSAQDFEAAFGDVPVWALPEIATTGLYQVEIVETTLGLSKFPNNSGHTPHYVRLLCRASLVDHDNYTGQATLYCDLDVAPNTISPQYSQLLCAAKCYSANPQNLVASVALRQSKTEEGRTIEYVPELEGKTIYAQIEVVNFKLRPRKYFDADQFSPFEKLSGQPQPLEFQKFLAMQPKEPGSLLEHVRQSASQKFTPPAGNTYQAQAPAIQAPAMPVPNTPWTAAAAQQMQQAQQRPMTPAAAYYGNYVSSPTQPAAPMPQAAPLPPAAQAPVQQAANVNNPYMTNAQDSGDIPF